MNGVKNMKFWGVCFIVLLAFMVFLTGCSESLNSSENGEMVNSGYGISLNASYKEDATVYKTIDQMTADADYIFKGTLSRTETFEDPHCWYEIYTVTEMYKGELNDREIRLTSSTPHHIGDEHYVFATVEEMAVYPYPCITPIYNQAVFKVEDDGSISLEYIVDKQMFPAVYDDHFIKKPAQCIIKSPGILKTRQLPKVVDEYPDIRAMEADSDLIVKVVFKEIEKCNKYVWRCSVQEIEECYKHEQEVPLPKTIFVNRELVAGEEYIVFLKKFYDGTEISAREGAIISRSDSAMWNEVMNLLQAK